MSPLTFLLTTDENDFTLFSHWMAETDPWKQYKLDEKKCLNAFLGEGKEVYKVIMNDGPIAFAILQMIGSFKGYIQTICVEPSHRNTGAGHKILQFCEDRIRKVSPNIFICVSTINPRAQKLYEEVGFEAIGVIKNFVVNGYDEILMRKTFGSIYQI